MLISEITEIKIGQNTPNFKRNPLPQFESRSFSVIYGGRSLDVVCKDKREFQTWTTGLMVRKGERERGRGEVGREEGGEGEGGGGVGGGEGGGREGRGGWKRKKTRRRIMKRRKRRNET